MSRAAILFTLLLAGYAITCAAYLAWWLGPAIFAGIPMTLAFLKLVFPLEDGPA